MPRHTLYGSTDAHVHDGRSLAPWLQADSVILPLGVEVRLHTPPEACSPNRPPQPHGLVYVLVGSWCHDSRHLRGTTLGAHAVGKFGGSRSHVQRDRLGPGGWVQGLRPMPGHSQASMPPLQHIRLSPDWHAEQPQRAIGSYDPINRAHVTMSGAELLSKLRADRRVPGGFRVVQGGGLDDLQRERAALLSLPGAAASR